MFKRAVHIVTIKVWRLRFVVDTVTWTPVLLARKQQ
jgi:hypothetical protein